MGHLYGRGLPEKGDRPSSPCGGLWFLGVSPKNFEKSASIFEGFGVLRYKRGLCGERDPEIKIFSFLVF
jgi:hypothetical protein